MGVRGEYKGAYALLHDDMEEDLVGSDWHQRAINSLYNSLHDLADRTGQPWHVGNQLPLVAWKPNGDPWRPSPDIMVHPQASPAPRDEMSARDDGAPALIVEVASPSTWRYDVDAADGKAAGYLALGVQDYLVFDPTGNLLQPQCRAWHHVEGGRTRAWEPDPNGRYVSGPLGIALRPEGELLRVYDGQGRPMPYDFEKTRELLTQARQLEARVREIEQLRAELAHLHGQAPPSSPADDHGTPTS